MKTMLLRYLMLFLVPVLCVLAFLCSLSSLTNEMLLIVGTLVGLAYGMLGLTGFKAWLGGSDPSVARAWHIAFQAGATRVATIVIFLAFYVLLLFVHHNLPNIVFEDHPLWTRSCIVLFTAFIVGLPTEQILIRAFMHS